MAKYVFTHCVQAKAAAEKESCNQMSPHFFLRVIMTLGFSHSFFSRTLSPRLGESVLGTSGNVTNPIRSLRNGFPQQRAAPLPLARAAGRLVAPAGLWHPTFYGPSLNTPKSRAHRLSVLVRWACDMTSVIRLTPFDASKHADLPFCYPF